jgi:hypothetical protein
MARVVWKYAIPTGQQAFDIPMPMGAIILTAKLQEGLPVIWAQIDDDPDLPTVDRSFVVVETGTPIKQVVTQHVGTLLHDRGSYVQHVFEIAGG